VFLPEIAEKQDHHEDTKGTKMNRGIWIARRQVLGYKSFPAKTPVVLGGKRISDE